MGLRILLPGFSFSARSDLFHDIPKFIMFEVPLLIFFAVLFQLLFLASREKSAAGREQQEETYQWEKTAKIMYWITKFASNIEILLCLRLCKSSLLLLARCFSVFLLRPSSSTWLDSKNFYVFSLRQAQTHSRNHPASRNKTSLEAKRITRMKYTLKTTKKMCEGGKNKNSNENTIFFILLEQAKETRMKNQGHLGQFGNVLFTLGSFSAPTLTPRSVSTGRTSISLRNQWLYFR